MEDDKGLIKKVSKWKRVHEITSQPQLFIDGTEEGDVNQGGLGDCWFIGAMSVVTINFLNFLGRYKTTPHCKFFRNFSHLRNTFLWMTTLMEQLFVDSLKMENGTEL
jgi:hypothetical protein